jgi:hypothetical protein
MVDMMHKAELQAASQIVLSTFQSVHWAAATELTLETVTPSTMKI